MASSITQVNNRDEVYASYTWINASNPSTMFVNELGYFKMVQWVGKWVEFYSVPGDQCVGYGWCGAYGYCDPNNGQDFECTCLPGYEPRSTEEWNLHDASGGCIKKREELSMCGNGEGFVKVANVKIPDTSKAHVWMSLSMHQCKDECLRNCSCLAYTRAEGRAGAICVTWYGNLMDVKSSHHKNENASKFERLLKFIRLKAKCNLKSVTPFKVLTNGLRLSLVAVPRGIPNHDLSSDMCIDLDRDDFGLHLLVI
ncbi:hypothetical protein C3L33_21542, partial [Rhododendron williamsianum]